MFIKKIKSKLFFIDGNKEYSYDDLIKNINSVKNIKKIIQTENVFDMFTNLIASIIYDIPITIINGYLTSTEIGLMKLTNELDKSVNIKNLIQIDKLIFFKLFNPSNWTITLFTSGTTGVPKKITHTFSSLNRNIRQDSNNNTVWGLTYNETSIAGLQVFFQAFMNGNTIINLFNKSQNEIFNNIEKYKITHISATPTFYRLLFSTQKTFESVIRLTMGGEKFDINLLKKLQKIFFNAKILNIYASTEIGTLFVSRQDVFEINEQLKDFVKIENDELLIHKDYIGIFENNNDIIQNFYKTGDLVKVINKNPLTFKIIGRKNDIVDVGGYNVNLTEIESIINSHPDVILSRVYSRKSSITGNILMADVKTKSDICEKELVKFLSTKFQPYKIPRIFNFVDDLTITKAYKVAR